MFTSEDMISCAYLILHFFLDCIFLSFCFFWLGSTKTVFPCFLVTFSYGVPGKVWYLIVSTPDLCLLFYFNIAYRTIHCVFI